MNMENGVTDIAEVGLEYELNPSERKEVRDRYPKVYFPDPIKEPLWFGRRDHRRIPDRKVIFDQSPEKEDNNPGIFGICSDRYKIIHYEDIVHMVENSVGKITDFGTVKVLPHTYLDGARMRISVDFPDMKYEIKKVDSIIPKISIHTSYDLSTKLKGQFGAWQLKCTNGMGVWKAMKAFSKRHLQNLFLNQLGETISGGLSLYGEQINQWKLWTEKPIPELLYKAIWDELPFSEAERKKIEVLPEIGTNLEIGKALTSKSLDLWSLNSVLTQFANHGVKSEIRRIELEPRIAQVMERAFDGHIRPAKSK